MEPWIDFGFASCTCQEEEEAELAGEYLHLITTCTSDVFCKAYRERRLLDLFHAQGLRVSDSTHLRDLHRPADMTKSVWYLKQYIMEDAAVQKAVMHSSVMVDYGFMNCKNDAEKRQLKRMYKAFFDSHGDPLALHEATIQGNLHGFPTKVVQGLRDCKFERLMKNPYPLPDS